MFGRFFLVLLCVAFVYAAQECDILTVGGFSPVCKDKKKPYCVRFNSNDDTVCSECVSSCDCGMDEYCSSAPTTVGTCVKFEKYGDKCYPYDTTQILNSDYDEELKCAMIYSQGGNYQIDALGACIEGKCRYCNPRAFSDGLPWCLAGQGMKEERLCVYPGKLVDWHKAVWSQGLNYELGTYPTWLAIVFLWLLIIIGVQGAITFLRWRKGSGSSRPKKTKPAPAETAPQKTEDAPKHNEEPMQEYQQQDDAPPYQE